MPTGPINPYDYNHQGYKKLRYPALKRIGLSDHVINFLLDLEEYASVGDRTDLASSISALSGIRRVKGTRVRLSLTGKILEFNGKVWEFKENSRK
jgi:hypothetical protein